jgi:hypothetical protein
LKHNEVEHIMWKQNTLKVAVAALIIGLIGSMAVNARGGHGDHGGNGHNYSHHSDGNGGTWQMRDDQTRHCRVDIVDVDVVPSIEDSDGAKYAHSCSEWN